VDFLRLWDFDMKHLKRHFTCNRLSLGCAMARCRESQVKMPPRHINIHQGVSAHKLNPSKITTSRLKITTPRFINEYTIPGTPKKRDTSAFSFNRQKNSFQSTFQSGGDFFSQALKYLMTMYAGH